MPRDTMSTASSFGEHIVRHTTVSRTTLTESLLEDPVAAAERGAAPPEPPDMWSWPNAALYAHYTCIGLVNGMLTQALLPYCLYVVHGQPNVTAAHSRIQHPPPSQLHHPPPAPLTRASSPWLFLSRTLFRRARQSVRLSTYRGDISSSTARSRTACPSAACTESHI